MREISVEELKKRKMKFAVSCLALFSLSIYGTFFSDTKQGSIIGILSAVVGIIQWIKWDSIIPIIYKAEKEEKDKSKES